MQKYCFSIKTRSGQFIERLKIAGKDREDAERKLKQMYHYCEIMNCEPRALDATGKNRAASIESLASLIAK